MYFETYSTSVIRDNGETIYVEVAPVCKQSGPKSHTTTGVYDLNEVDDPFGTEEHQEESNQHEGSTSLGKIHFDRKTSLFMYVGSQLSDKEYKQVIEPIQYQENSNDEITF